jgi:hypothetical protein
MPPRRNGLARIVLRKTSLALPTTIVVGRDTLSENVIVRKGTRSLS